MLSRLTSVLPLGDISLINIYSLKFLLLHLSVSDESRQNRDSLEKNDNKLCSLCAFPVTTRDRKTQLNSPVRNSTDPSLQK